MSGIAALIHTGDKPVDELLIRLMTGSMAVRGPDDQAYRFDHNIALAQARLGNQRFSDKECFFGDNDIWISACVRIDRRHELIAKLEQRVPARELCDEQIIIHAYRKWGVNCLDHFIGDFAFILWDAGKKRLFCATDQFGVVPLFYAKIQHGLCLSNSLNTVRLHPDINSELSEAAIADYLMSRMNHTAEATIFKHINRLPPAHQLIFQDGQLYVEKYWSPTQGSDIRFKKPHEYVEEFQHTLSMAVKDRLSSNCIGTDLSGGMDSTSITALAHELLTQTGKPFNLHAYTLGSNGLLEDLEGPLASRMANDIGIEHHLYTPNRNRLVPEPTPLHLISPEPGMMRRSVHQTNKLRHIESYRGTLLTGFGGDPLLESRTLHRQDFKSLDNVFSLMLQTIYHYRAYRSLHSLRISGSSNKRQADLTNMTPGWLKPDFVKRSYLNDRLSERQARQNSINASQHGMVEDALWRRLFDWNDPGFTHVPVKVAHPFFDIRLLDLALQLPPFPWRHKKHLLRTAMAPNLPSYILNRVKTPVQGNRVQALLSAEGISSEAQALLNSPRLAGYISGEQLIHLYQATTSNQPPIGKSLMTTLTLSYWLNHYESIPVAITQLALTVPVRRIKTVSEKDSL
jgi:asparagine synthase (glutamine-hydrolysing)